MVSIELASVPPPPLSSGIFWIQSVCLVDHLKSPGFHFSEVCILQRCPPIISLRDKLWQGFVGLATKNFT